MRFSIPISGLLLMIAATVVFGAWINMIGRQYLPMLLFSVNFVIFLIIASIAWPHLKTKSLGVRILIGALIGYLASVASAAIGTLALWDSDQFLERFFPSSLYVWPVLSFGWLYGVAIVAILGSWGQGDGRRQPDGAYGQGTQASRRH